MRLVAQTKDHIVTMQAAIERLIKSSSNDARHESQAVFKETDSVTKSQANIATNKVRRVIGGAILRAREVYAIV